MMPGISCDQSAEEQFDNNLHPVDLQLDFLVEVPLVWSVLASSHAPILQDVHKHNANNAKKVFI